MNYNLLERISSFIEQATSMFPYDYSLVWREYINSATVVPIICNVSGHGIFWKSPNNHTNNKQGCTKCTSEREAVRLENNRIYWARHFVRVASILHDGFYIYPINDYIQGSYKGNDVKVQIICPIHGEFNQTPGSHKSGRGCKLCSRSKQQAANVASFNRCKELFTINATFIHDGKYTYEEAIYTGAKAKVIIKCPCHGNFEQSPSDHLQGKGCQECGKENSLENSEEYLKYHGEMFPIRAAIIHGNAFDYSLVEYKGTDVEVIIICKRCGFNFPQTPHNHLQDHGCSICPNKTELIIWDFLQEFKDMGIKRQATFEFSGRYRYDFQIGNTLIELDGPQHFKQVSNWRPPEQQQAADAEKMVLAVRNGYRIIRLTQEEVFSNKFSWQAELKRRIMLPVWIGENKAGNKAEIKITYCTEKRKDYYPLMKKYRELNA